MGKKCKDRAKSGDGLTGTTVEESRKEATNKNVSR